MTTRPAAPAPAAPPAPDVRPEAATPTHACLRCGREIALTEAICATCNPAGLPQPAASQAHGTVFGGIALAAIAMLIVGMIFVGGVGPFGVTLVDATPSGSGLKLTLAVANDGSREGSASCRVWDSSWLGNPPRETFIRTPPIPAHGSSTFEQVVNALGTRAGSLAVECSR